MRSRRLASFCAALLLLAPPAPVLAQAPAAPPAYEQHMASGKKLVEEESWAAAQAEFEAAYAASPRAAPLLQIAACLEALQRWQQAIATRERALRDHGSTLDEAERKAAEKDLAELRSQVGSVQVVLWPAAAILRVDGEDQPPAGPQRVLTLGPGPHRLEARLEGWSPAAQTVTVSGGETVAIKLGLAPDRGKITIHTPDEATKIAVDEEPMGQGTWSGWLPPGAHVIHVYTPGGAAFRKDVTVVAGESVEVSPATEGTPSTPPEEAGRRVRGPYGLLAFTTYVPLPPTDFSGTGLGFSGGVRLGYRFASIAGAELLIDYARAGASGQGTPSFADKPDLSVPFSYALSSFRAGLGVRLMTTGQRVRFVQVFGGGVAYDSLRWTPGAAAMGVTRQDASGADAFAISESGLEVDVAHVLLGLTLQQVLGSKGALTLGQHDKFSAESYSGPQYSLGLGLRAGYGLW